MRIRLKVMQLIRTFADEDLFPFSFPVQSVCSEEKVYPLFHVLCIPADRYSSHPRHTWIQACMDTRPRRCTNRRVGICICKTGALKGECIKIRSHAWRLLIQIMQRICPLLFCHNQYDRMLFHTPFSPAVFCSHSSRISSARHSGETSSSQRPVTICEFLLPSLFDPFTPCQRIFCHLFGHFRKRFRKIHRFTRVLAEIRQENRRFR